jgi:hypothetical protein
MRLGSVKTARPGALRSEGKKFVVKAGDILPFGFNI